ncbi:uncharacterized protein J3R85_016679, partial [Psidium guajava]
SKRLPIPAHQNLEVLGAEDTVGFRSDTVATMIDDQDLGFLANFLGIFIFALVIAYHYVTADPKYEGN